MDERSLTVDDARIAVIGLGYVGLPLAVEFGKILPTVGFDINTGRIAELRAGTDRTLEVDPDEMRAAARLSYTDDLAAIADCNVYIVTVPTPIDAHNRPDLTPLCRASDSVGRVISKGDIVIYESTVYPGATEEDCIPIVEAVSGLAYNRDFFAGYSPERINPGDRNHRLPVIKKVTSGSTPEMGAFVDALYGRIITAGTHLAPTIRVAEAAKVIENTQRDVNIALINELALIFDRLGIDTLDVLEAAGTKWNFLPFRPGLVGGHCIGVDPYYLTHKAESLGYHPEVVLAGRRINDGMGAFVVGRLVRDMIHRGVGIKGARVLLLGITFKENCPDIRNTGVIGIVEEARDFGLEVDVHDVMADPDEVAHEYGIRLVEAPSGPYDAIIVAVAHKTYVDSLPASLPDWSHANTVLFDLKGVLPRHLGARRL